MKKLFVKLGGMVSVFALAVTAMNVNAACIYWVYQPQLPDNAAKLRKF